MENNKCKCYRNEKVMTDQLCPIEADILLYLITRTEREFA
jgi:hypothetical protein